MSNLTTSAQVPALKSAYKPSPVRVWFHVISKHIRPTVYKSLALLRNIIKFTFFLPYQAGCGIQDDVTKVDDALNNLLCSIVFAVGVLLFSSIFGPWTPISCFGMTVLWYSQIAIPFVRPELLKLFSGVKTLYLDAEQEVIRKQLEK